MRILVTGGLGFIGSEYVRQVINDSRVSKITVVDAMTYAANIDSLNSLVSNPKLEIIKSDIGNKNIIDELMQNIDILVNFAAESHVDNSLKGIDPFIKSNINGVAVLLECARINKVKKFIQISTDEVYGSCEFGAFTENSMLNPRNPYSATKAAAENLCNAYIETYGLCIYITRSSNNYGPFQQIEKYIPNAISNLINGKKINVYGDGSQQREWIHVSDNVSAICGLTFSNARSGIFNIGSGRHLTNLEVAEKITSLMGLTIKEIEFVEDRLGHDFRYSINSSKICKEINWKPQIVFEEGLAETIEWYKKHYNRGFVK